MSNRDGHRAVTLRDVAVRARVSLSTASRVLNGGHYASDEAIERVLEAARALDYRANESARALRRARTMTFGVVFHHLRNPSVLDLLEGIESASDDRGYSVLVTSARDSSERYVALIRRLLERRVDALLLSNPNDALLSEIEFARRAGVPVVALSTRTRGVSHVPIVHAPSRDQMHEMLRTLAERGHRSLSFVGSVRGVPDRGFPGLQEAAAGYGIRLIEEPPLDYGESAAIKSLDALLARRDRPTVLFVMNRALPSTIARLADRGFRVPEDISVVNFNDSGGAATVGLVAEIHVDSRQVGAEAARVAADWVEGKEPENRRSLLIAKWHPAPSLGPAPTLSPAAP
ncbi:MAG: LacI family transcriptional regulator [Dehalococcoidia bacterium]|nr:LacI family transcriptional regulator [Dehalococcoidia bacterium]